MKSQFTANSSILINASTASVWSVLTNPVHIKKYLFGTNTVTDWKVGSPIYFRGEWEGKKYEDKGVILEIVAEKILKYSYWSNLSGTEDTAANYQIISNLLKSINGQTELTITQENCKSEEAKDHTQQNWKMILESIKTLAEEQ